MVLSENLIRCSLRLIGVKKLLNCNLRCSNYKNFRYLNCTAINFKERRYTEKHEWVIIDGDVGTVGITSYAQESLGDVVYAQLPDIGTKLTQNDECGAIESVKAASELFSPVSGSVVEKNVKVEETPALINNSCYDKGWLFKVKLVNPKEISELMNEEKYDEFLKTGDH